LSKNIIKTDEELEKELEELDLPKIREIVIHESSKREEGYDAMKSYRK
jgi:hypothetical protein